MGVPTLSHETGFTLWLTGPVASGKSSLAQALKVLLEKEGRPTEVLSSTLLRPVLSPELSYSRTDLHRHHARLVLLCQLLNRHSVVTLVDSVSPVREDRDQARMQIGDFLEIYLSTALEVRRERDPQARYRAAETGSLPNFAGINCPYEAPAFPEVTVDAALETPEEAARRIHTVLVELAYLPAPGQAKDLQNQERGEEIVKKRLEDLGYF